MNKQRYIAPCISVVVLDSESIMLDTSSVVIHSDAEVQDENLTNRYSWDSNNWVDNGE